MHLLDRSFDSGHRADRRRPHRVLLVAALSLATTTCTLCGVPSSPPEWDWEWPLIELHDTGPVIEPEIAFLPGPPRIDGLLDPGLASLARRSFPYVAKHKGTVDRPVSPASYRLGYGAEFLYLYVEAGSDGLTYRDRAYQMGDGFYLILGRANPAGDPTDQFLAVAGSAVNEPGREKYRRFIWFDSEGNLFRPLGPGSEMKFAEEDGRISFELLLPWSDIRPFHPWSAGELGFNLVLCRALPGEGDEQHRYMIVPDPDQQFEGKPKMYQKLAFEPPRGGDGFLGAVWLARHNISEGEPLLAMAAITCPEGSESRLEIRIAPEAGDSWVRAEAKLPCGGSLARHEIELPTRRLPSGAYQARWSVPGGEERALRGFTVFPEIGFDALRRRVDALGEGITAGSRTTMLLHLGELQSALTNRDPRESYRAQHQILGQLTRLLEQMEAGQDVYASRTGLFRRGFRSGMDGSIQPYAILVPEDFQSGRRYPLIVFLHGSGETESSLRGFEFISPGDAIVMAPRARGTSHDFHPEEAQRDIAEAVEDVVKNYPVDETRIVLSGFSMGGYGVYRTYLETPRRYAAIAVFAGTHAGRFHPEGAPDFLEGDHLEPFRGLQAFVFHGKDDLNCPYREAVRMVERLEEAGAQVEFVSEEGTGHERPGEESVRAYHRWLRQVLKAGG